MAEPTPTGFQGLSAFSTDVDRAIAAADRIASASPGSTPAQPSSGLTSPAIPVHRDGGAVLSGLKKLGGWVVGIGILLAVKACIWGGVHAVRDSGSTSYSAAPTGQSSQYDTARDATDTATDSITGEAVDSATGGNQMTSSTPDETSVAAEDDGAESKPMQGYATLSLSEIRYCMAEDIRISAQKTEIDSLQYTDVDRFNRNVDGFNETVNDYNSRCSNRSIMSNDRPLATSQVEGRRSQLETEGRARVQ